MPSGRESHAEKITVYLTEDEHLDLEQFRLTVLRKGIKVDRGNIVRAAIEHLIDTGDDETIYRLLNSETED